MFKKLKEMLGSKKEEVKIEKYFVLSPIEGEAISVNEVSDPTFAQELLGKGIAIKPSKGRVVAPVDGEIGMIFKTNHAVSLISNDGVEMLIHVGIDTVNLNGEHYKSYVSDGDKVKKGDLLLEFDVEKIEQAGYDTVTPVVICNTDNYSNVEITNLGSVKELDNAIEISK
ncbi:MAG: PTS sugar transporter subunit IIA [Peptostreptococcaceae bacterium]